jgi:hypothetical protein
LEFLDRDPSETYRQLIPFQYSRNLEILGVLVFGKIDRVEGTKYFHG